MTSPLLKEYDKRKRYEITNSLRKNFLYIILVVVIVSIFSLYVTDNITRYNIYNMDNKQINSIELNIKPYKVENFGYYIENNSPFKLRPIITQNNDDVIVNTTIIEVNENIRQYGLLKIYNPTGENVSLVISIGCEKC